MTFLFFLLHLPILMQLLQLLEKISKKLGLESRKGFYNYLLLKYKKKVPSFI